MKNYIIVLCTILITYTVGLIFNMPNWFMYIWGFLSGVGWLYFFNSETETTTDFHLGYTDTSPIQMIQYKDSDIGILYNIKRYDNYIQMFVLEKIAWSLDCPVVLNDLWKSASKSEPNHFYPSDIVRFKPEVLAENAKLNLPHFFKITKIHSESEIVYYEDSDGENLTSMCNIVHADFDQNTQDKFYSSGRRINGIGRVYFGMLMNPSTEKYGLMTFHTDEIGILYNILNKTNEFDQSILYLEVTDPNIYNETFDPYGKNKESS